MLQCMKQLNGEFKQEGVNQLSQMEVNGDGLNNGGINNTQEIYLTGLPIWSTTKE